MFGGMISFHEVGQKFNGSPKRWEKGRIFHLPEGKDYKWYISGIFCQLGDGLCHLPPFRGTRNNH